MVLSHFQSDFFLVVYDRGVVIRVWSVIVNSWSISREMQKSGMIRILDNNFICCSNQRDERGLLVCGSFLFF